MTTSDYLTQLQQDREDLVDNLETKGITGLTGDETFTELVPEVLNISGGGGADLSDYFTSSISQGTSNFGGVLLTIKRLPNTITVDTSVNNCLLSLFREAAGLVEAPNIDTTGAKGYANYMFNKCSSLTTFPVYDFSQIDSIMGLVQQSGIVTFPLINTENVTNMRTVCWGCSNLTTFPVLNTSKVTSFDDMFTNCTSLTDTSLDNILQMCINASVYDGVKTLYKLGFRSNQYAASRIEALPHYQDFIDAGWTIGY